jgi:hypothetical protein
VCGVNIEKNAIGFAERFLNSTSSERGLDLARVISVNTTPDYRTTLAECHGAPPVPTELIVHVTSQAAHFTSETVFGDGPEAALQAPQQHSQVD